MLAIIKAIIYGIVEGITEWLPVSSTGHLILVEKLIPFDEVSEGFFEMFDVVIQLGAIMAVVLLFWNKLWPFAMTTRAQEKEAEDRKAAKVSLGTSTSSKTYEIFAKWPMFFKAEIWEMWMHVLVSCIPAIIIGLLFDDLFDALFYNYVCVAIALIVFGIAFIVVENWNKGKQPKVGSIAEITYTTALLIGIFQLLAAIFPGTSRSGATIVGALLIGVSRSVAAEYTFILAVPVMFGASLLKVVKFGFDFSTNELAILLVGTVVAFVVSILVLRFLLSYIRKHDFTVFGWYRIILGILVLIVFPRL